MKKVYSSDSFFLIGQLRELLEHRHIRCIAKNEYLIGGAGELPPNECWPELWVLDDDRLDEARELVEEFIAAPEAGAGEWLCPACGERLEGQFAACWRCGASRPLQDE